MSDVKFRSVNAKPQTCRYLYITNTVSYLHLGARGSVVG
jgi:hypothetical protein